MPAEYALDVTVDQRTGRVLGAYLHIRPGQSAKTKEWNDGLVRVDDDTAGQLLGIEMLGPCNAKGLDSLRIERRAKAFCNEPHRGS